MNSPQIVYKCGFQSSVCSLQKLVQVHEAFLKDPLFLESLETEQNLGVNLRKLDEVHTWPESQWRTLFRCRRILNKLNELKMQRGIDVTAQAKY